MHNWGRCESLIILITANTALRLSTFQNVGWTGMHGEILDPANQKVSQYQKPAETLSDLSVPSVATGRSKYLCTGDILFDGKIVIDEIRAFNLGEFINGKPNQKVPKAFASHVAELADFENRCSSMCHQIFRLLAMGLEVNASLPINVLFFPR